MSDDTVPVAIRPASAAHISQLMQMLDYGRLLELTENERDAWSMGAACEDLREALVRAGFSPR